MNGSDDENNWTQGEDGTWFQWRFVNTDKTTVGNSLGGAYSRSGLSGESGRRLHAVLGRRRRGTRGAG